MVALIAICVRWKPANYTTPILSGSERWPCLHSLCIPEVCFEDALATRATPGRLKEVPYFIRQQVSLEDRFFYAAIMDLHRRRLLLERCRLNLRKRNEQTQTGLLRKTSSSKHRPVQFQDRPASSPVKSVNFQVLHMHISYYSCAPWAEWYDTSIPRIYSRVQFSPTMKAQIGLLRKIPSSEHRFMYGGRPNTPLEVPSTSKNRLIRLI